MLCLSFRSPVLLGLQPNVSICLYLINMSGVTDNCPESELKKTKIRDELKELVEFQANFKLGGETKPHVNGQQNDTTLDELRTFQKSFNLCLDKPNQAKVNQQIPSTLPLSSKSSSIPRTRKKHRKPPVSKMFDEVYHLTEEVLGRGAHSCVTTCTHRTSTKKFAVKIVPKGDPSVREKVLREIEILYHCRNHKNILHLVESFEETERFCLVFHRMAGGPLLSHIQRRERFTEREASQVVQEVATALAFLHDNGIAHRDLKPENILCERESKVLPVCICDFDLSSMVLRNSAPVSTPLLLTPVGSAEFMAPEVVETFLGDAFAYDKKCDLWSLGVTLYMMLCGKPPFTGGCGEGCGWDRGGECRKCKDLLLTRIQNGDYEFNDKEWSGISSEAKDLIRHLLERDVKARLSAHQVLKHQWVVQEQPETPLLTPGALKRTPSVRSELSIYAASCVALTRQLSSKLAQEETDHLTELRTSYDSSHTHSTSKTHPQFTLSPPGSSELAVRRKDEHK